MTGPLLQVENLHVRFRRDGTLIHPVRGVSLRVCAGECVAVVGESGCGKSLTALSIARLPPTDRAAVTGRVVLDDIDISAGRAAELASVRGRRVAYVFQDPAGSLNPVMRVGDQIGECLRDLPTATRRVRVEDLLGKVGLADPGRCARAYPCMLSGGMQQRVMLAMALAQRPKLLIADEPTTALDVVTQQGVLDLIGSLAASEGLAVLLITHNLALVAGRADRVYVMYGGQVIESGATAALLTTPRHPYTRGLLAAAPRLDDPPGRRLPDIPGVVPGADAWPAGCAFAPRHPSADARCHRDPPPESSSPDGRTCRCWQDAG